MAIPGQTTYALPGIVPLTLPNLLSYQNDMAIKRIFSSSIKAHDIGNDLPTQTFDVLTYRNKRILGGQSMNVMRSYNSSGTWRPVVPVDYSENIALIGIPITLDVEADGLDTEIGEGNQWTKHLDEAGLGITYAKANFYINNSQVAGKTTLNNNPDNPGGAAGAPGPTGVLGRMFSNDPTSNGINPTLAAGYQTNIAWSPLTSVSSAAVPEFKAFATQAINRMGGSNDWGEFKMFLCDPLQTALNFALEIGAGKGTVSITKDQLDRDCLSIGGAGGEMIIRNLGRLPADFGGNQSNYIISNAEDVNGNQPTNSPGYLPTGSNTYTSAYIVRPGKDHASLWQKRPLMRTPVFWLPGGSSKQMAINWSMGIIFNTTLDVTRLYGNNVSGLG